SSFEKSYDSSYDKTRQSSYDKSRESAYEKSGEKASQSSDSISKSYSEANSFDLSNTVSFQVLTPTGWANPVTNTATLSGSVNGGSGNLGVNVAAGVGNQQSNSLAISNTSF
ncbi:MAG: heme utilization protein, partial [Delftia acidovorans]